MPIVKQQITNEELAKARKQVEAERKILAALYHVKPDHRIRVLRAVAILYGVELGG